MLEFVSALICSHSASYVVRANIGRDFGSWAVGFSEFPYQPHAESCGGSSSACDVVVLLANDSVFGPLSPLNPALLRFFSSGADLFGFTESLEVRCKWQSRVCGTVAARCTLSNLRFVDASRSECAAVLMQPACFRSSAIVLILLFYFTFLHSIVSVLCFPSLPFTVWRLHCHLQRLAPNSSPSQSGRAAPAKLLPFRFPPALVRANAHILKACSAKRSQPPPTPLPLSPQDFRGLAQFLVSRESFCSID